MQADPYTVQCGLRGVGRGAGIAGWRPAEDRAYLLLGRLGAGGMGQVFLGRSPGGRLVAVKVIRPELAGDPGFRARFDREVAAARRVSGVFTTPVVDADLASAVPWLATGYVNGPSLAQAVDELRTAAGCLGAGPGRRAGRGAGCGSCRGSGAPRPEAVQRAAGTGRAAVIDFGISQAADATHLTRTGTVIGSPAFMSPEQVLGRPVGRPAMCSAWARCWCSPPPVRSRSGPGPPPLSCTGWSTPHRTWIGCPARCGPWPNAAWPRTPRSGPPRGSSWAS